ncbi:hypothetical protein [Streptomyces sp. NPDC047974]|uniref:hypothetical protein n=1 Tax=Streptomyces sp. NPDC047974 TaxID=3154343 RepID=UPI0033E00384
MFSSALATPGEEDILGLALTPAAVARALTRQMTVRNASLERPEGAHQARFLAMVCSRVGDGAEGVCAFRGKRALTTWPASAVSPFCGQWIAATVNA